MLSELGAQAHQIADAALFSPKQYWRASALLSSLLLGLPGNSPAFTAAAAALRYLTISGREKLVSEEFFFLVELMEHSYLFEFLKTTPAALHRVSAQFTLLFRPHTPYRYSHKTSPS